jgi:hypothetical protein
MSRAPSEEELQARDDEERANLFETISALGLSVTDKYYIAPEKIPAGSSYEWRTYAVMGQVDSIAAFHLTRAGWTPVAASRHPELKAPSSDGDNIVIEGMILMERPKEVTAAAQERARKNADDHLAVARRRSGTTSTWEPPVTFRLTDAEKEIAVQCYASLGQEGAYYAYEQAKDREARLRRRYGGTTDETRRFAMDFALKANAATVKAAGGLVPLAKQIESYLKETE